MKLSVSGQELTESSKQPIRTRYLGHMTGYQPIRDQYLLIRSVPAIMYLELASWGELTPYPTVDRIDRQ